MKIKKFLLLVCLIGLTALTCGCTEKESPKIVTTPVPETYTTPTPQKFDF